MNTSVLSTPLCQFGGTILFVGFGTVAQAVLPLLLRHVNLSSSKDKIVIVTSDNRGKEVADELGVEHHVLPITRENYSIILSKHLKKGDFLVNLSVNVSSLALMEFCIERGVMYLDTCIEPWEGVYTNMDLSPSHRSNYYLREEVMALRDKLMKDPMNMPTILPTHGANPGLISHFVKQGLVNLSQDLLGRTDIPKSKREWAALARELNIKVIHCSERDTQVAFPETRKKKGEFVNTWSADGFISEGSQPSELGWGTHEKSFPPDGHLHEFGCQAAIYLNRPGASVQVRTWAPTAGPFHGFLITHSEAISISNYLTVKEKRLTGDKVEDYKESKVGYDDDPLEEVVVYRPTCHYAYHPCDDTVLSVDEFAANNWQKLENHRVYRQEEIADGIDELGALLMGHEKGAYWFGSKLSIQEARSLAPYNTATSLQIASGVLGAIVWCIENPTKGIIEPEDMDYRRVLEVATPYLGNVSGAYTTWTPLVGRSFPFPEENIDESDPWQFKNIRCLNVLSNWKPIKSHPSSN